MLARWYFHLIIWCISLWRVARPPLRLNPLHPDRAGGLGFFNAVNSGVGSGLTGFHSSTTGYIASGGGNKVVHMGPQVPPGYRIRGVRVCYELSNRRTFISNIRLAQVKTPPATASVLLDDGTNQTNPGPICVDRATTAVDSSLGEVLLSLRVNFGDTSDRIVVRALGLHLV